jgi:ketosteroid isomerase-like protein
VTDHVDLAERIRAAYAGTDLVAFGKLLAPDVRWGEDHPNQCRSPQEVIATFEGWIGSGVTADVLRIDAGQHGVLAHLHVRWTDPNDQSRGAKFFHVFMTDDGGQITEIRRYNDLKSASGAIGGR